MRHDGLATISCLVSLLACSTPTAPVAEGSWGGAQASLVLTPSGGMVSYPCGNGTIDSTWTLTPDGRFTATGQHFFGGGPIPPEGHPPHPARYVGLVAGERLTLTIIVLDLSDTLGPLHLTRGGPPVAEQCV
jgi:hypothetical protein